jgi:hypothetical protein
MRYNTAFFPFDVVSLLRALARQGFVLPDSLSPLPVGLGGRIELNGVIARKAEVGIRMDSDKIYLGVVANEPKTALAELKMLEETLQQESYADTKDQIAFYEALVTATVRTGQNPLVSWERAAHEISLVRELSGIFRSPLVPFGLRLAGQGEVPTSHDWVDIRIEPFVQSATTHHSVEAVFRRREREPVVSFVQRCDDIITGMIATVEGRR